MEFQKRGLPHAHILLWLHQNNKYPMAEDIDKIITVEIPSKEHDSIGHDAVVQFTMLGACGTANNNSPCMVDGVCTKKFPKKFFSETTID